MLNASQGASLTVLSDRETDIKSNYGQPKHIVSILPCQKHTNKPAGRIPFTFPHLLPTLQQL